MNTGEHLQLVCSRLLRLRDETSPAGQPLTDLRRPMQTCELSERATKANGPLAWPATVFFASQSVVPNECVTVRCATGRRPAGCLEGSLAGCVAG